MKVSVIVATYGSDEWKERGSGAPLMSGAQQQPHEAFALHDADPDATLAKVRNQAAAHATGDWLLFVDGDDALERGYIGAMYRARIARQRHTACQSCEPVACLFVPAVRYLDPDGTPREPRPRIPNWGRPLDDVNCAVIGTLIHREIFHAVGGFREWPLYEDWDLWLRAVRYGCSLVPVLDAVYRANVSPGGRNEPAEKVKKQAYDAIRADLGIGSQIKQLAAPARLPGGCRGCGGSQR